MNHQERERRSQTGGATKRIETTNLQPPPPARLPYDDCNVVVPGQLGIQLKGSGDGFGWRHANLLAVEDEQLHGTNGC
eukprot:m.231262 g.231262  ORF g.231262 m.231262 type:complete len:78 (+) comp54274_c0_seq8:648-881(+)